MFMEEITGDKKEYRQMIRIYIGNNRSAAVSHDDRQDADAPDQVPED